MLAFARTGNSTMHGGGEQDLRGMHPSSRDDYAEEPHDGLLNLALRLENEEDHQFDVDITILDFLVYKATDLVFEWMSSADPYNSDLPNALVSMTADWRIFLKQRHQGRCIDSVAAFRSRLLQFALVFTHRLHQGKTWTSEESLFELRDENKSRAKYWKEHTEHPPALSQPFDHHKSFPLSDGALHANRNQLASALNMPQGHRGWVTDVAGTPSLQCLLPLFIELTVARTDLNDDWLLTREWFDLAGQFMMQAVIEEYLRNGAHGDDAFNTAFAFGCPGTDRWADEPFIVAIMRRLFCDENNPREENRDWTTIKRQYINKLLPQNPSQPSLQAIQMAEERYSYGAFEKRLLSFLQNLHDGLIKPDLAQVEEGHINT